MRTKKAIQYNEYKEREIEKAIANFSQQLMSNSKWVKLVENLIKHIDEIKKIEFKKVATEQMGELYLKADTSFGFDYWQDGFEEHNSLGGSLRYKEIEFLLFPKNVDASGIITQDLKNIAQIIDSVGSFTMEVSEEYLKLVCYRN